MDYETQLGSGMILTKNKSAIILLDLCVRNLRESNTCVCFLHVNIR